MARIPCRKPLISKKNQNVRLDFATEHIVWTEEQWNMVHFSDKSKFNLLGSDGKRFVRRKNGERLSPQNCEIWRGSVMVCRSGPIVRFHVNINASVYKELLRQHGLPHLRKGTVEALIFMQNNAPCHKAKTGLSFLEEKGIALIRWPPQSQDMNPIENVWKLIGKKAPNRNSQNIDDLGVF